MMTPDPLCFHPEDLLKKVKEAMVRTPFRHYPVVDQEGRPLGLISRTHLLAPRRKRLILVDHNESIQAVEGVEEAQILEIVDHHRLGDMETPDPVMVRLEPVGSTSTIISKMYRESGLMPENPLAGIMAAAILSDTLMFRSPTSTPEDQREASRLAAEAGVNLEWLGREMFRAGSLWTYKDPREIISQDFKEFKFFDFWVGIGQVQVLESEALPVKREELFKELVEIQKEKGYDLMEEGSEIPYYGPGAPLLEKALGLSQGNWRAFLPGVVSPEKTDDPASEEGFAVYSQIKFLGGWVLGIAKRLETAPLGAFHYRLLLILGLGWLFEAMDVGLIGFVLPAVAKDWQLDPVAMGTLGSVGLLGLGLGAILGGMMGDVWGRRKVLISTLLFYSFFTLLAGLSPNYTWLLIFRFLVGLGLGAEIPVVFTLMSEFSPAAHRGWLTVLLESFWAFGWIAAALIGYLVVPRWGWRVAFFLGATPALYTTVLRRALPESPRYLERRGRIKEALEIVSLVTGKPVVIERSEAEGSPPKVTLKDLWSPAYLRRTLTLWVLWFGINFSYYGLNYWLPSLMVGKGFTIVKGFEYVLIMTLGQVPGYFSAAFLVDRIGRKPVLASYLLMSGIAAYFFSQSISVAQLIWWGLVVYFFNLGAWGVLYAYTPEVYPTGMRAAGSGWASFVGRLGAIAAPLAVGKMISWWGQEAAYPYIFYLFAATFVITALAMLLWGEETRGRTLEEISPAD